MEPWEDEHLNPKGFEKPSRWNARSLLDDVEQVDLLWVDGPPGATCLFSRYPALPALADKLSRHAEVWLDDTIRQEEQDICERWAKDYGFTVAYYPLEKGLGRLTRPGKADVGSMDSSFGAPSRLEEGVVSLSDFVGNDHEVG